MNTVTRFFALSALITAFATAATAQVGSSHGGAFLNPMPFTKPKPLGLYSVSRTDASQYNAAATKAALAPKPSTATHQSLASKSVLVLYDSTGTYGYLGDIYSQQMSNLLNHFNVTVTRMPVESYKSGMINAQQATFYLGLIYDNALPTAFLNDALNAARPICWMGYNLWKIAWNADNSWNSTFSNRYGLCFNGIDTLGYPTVSYKGQNLVKQQFDPAEGSVGVTDPTRTIVLAKSTRPDGLSMNYITQGQNFFYVADNPFSYTTNQTQNDRILAFEDCLHWVLESGAAVDHRATIRVEDVSQIVPPAKLRAIADTMAAEGVPFVVSVIPCFADPLGHENGKPTWNDMRFAPDFVAALHYMESKGGQIIQHGTTHQYGSVTNPYTGESAADFEFFRVTENADGSQKYVGPIPEDNPAWALNRILTGKAILWLAGFTNIQGWDTPHYMASPVDYAEIQRDFSYSLCRGLVFSQDANKNLYYVQQHSPWAYTDQFGIKRIPETIGYVSLDGAAANPPANVIQYATANSVVRDGWAGMYFHWFLDPALLKQLLQGVKAQGYRFVMPSASLK